MPAFPSENRLKRSTPKVHSARPFCPLAYFAPMAELSGRIGDSRSTNGARETGVSLGSNIGAEPSSLSTGGYVLRSVQSKRKTSLEEFGDHCVLSRQAAAARNHA